jgi:hypothetical protein
MDQLRVLVSIGLPPEEKNAPRRKQCGQKVYCLLFRFIYKGLPMVSRILILACCCSFFLYGCDGEITIDGTIYEIPSSDSSYTVIGKRISTNPELVPLSGVSIFIFTGEKTNEEIDKFVNENKSSHSQIVSDSNGAYHYDEITYPDKESFTIIFWKMGYRTAIGKFSKSKAYLDESICAFLMKDSINQ